MKTLITGGYGFLGRNAAKLFSECGDTVIGIGHGQWLPGEAEQWGFSSWINADISLEALEQISLVPDLVIHCGGSGSVFFSTREPYLDFVKTVCSTAAVLEYIRKHAPAARLIYPSSPAVHGAHDESPIKISDAINPVSPYGRHKKMAEELCFQYSGMYGLRVAVIRFFSIYGNGLKKQLLWDACAKITGGDSEAVFWGTGNETRDFIHVSDAVALLRFIAGRPESSLLANGGSGRAFRIEDVLTMIAGFARSNTRVKFNGVTREGDPVHYHADMTETESLGWRPGIDLASGLASYVDWFLQEKKK
jgi:UDP-glucose 4-epimerase